MIRPTQIVMIVLGLALLGASPVSAEVDPNWDAAITGHISPVVTKGHCTTAKPALTVSTIDYEIREGCDTGESYTIWFLVCNGSDSVGVRGMEFGIDYNSVEGVGGGVDVNATYLCADLQFPSADWPAPGSGTIITWAPWNCQYTNSVPYIPDSVIAIALAMDVSVYSPDQLRITPRPVSGQVKVASCLGSETVISDPWSVGIMGFCEPGLWGCWVSLPVQTTTWGRLKALSGS